MKQALMIYYQKFAKLGLKQTSTLKCCSIGATTLRIMTLSITTFSVKGLYVTPRIKGTRHNNAELCRMSRFIYCYAESRYAESRYAESCYAECH